ncbi:uncharacterized protein LAESUDRAFT_728210, partial [Laetiporus sulphureus 93-53]
MSNSSHVGGYSIVYMRHLLEENGRRYGNTDHLHRRFMEVVGSPRRPPPRIVLPKRKDKRLLVQSERSVSALSWTSIVSSVLMSANSPCIRKI